MSTGVKYEPTNGVASGTGNDTQFTYYDEASRTWKSLATNGSVTLKSSAYYYCPTTLIAANDVNAKVGIGVNTPEYKMLFTNSSTGADAANAGNTTNMYYWLGSPYVSMYTGYASFGLRYVGPGYVDYDNLCRSSGTTRTPYYGVRPVVSLDSKVRLKDSGTGKDGCKLYNLAVE